MSIFTILQFKNILDSLFSLFFNYIYGKIIFRKLNKITWKHNI